MKQELERLRRKLAERDRQIEEQAKQIVEAEKQIADLERQLALRQQNQTTTVRMFLDDEARLQREGQRAKPAAALASSR